MCPSCILSQTYFSTLPTIFIEIYFNLNFLSWFIVMCWWGNKILEMKTKKEQTQQEINCFLNWKNFFLFGKKSLFLIKTLWKDSAFYLNWLTLINSINYLSILNTKKSGKYLEVNKFHMNFKRLVLKMDCLTFKVKNKRQSYFWMLYST